MEPEMALPDILGSRGAIRPYGSAPWDGSQHCADDWHVLLEGVFDGGDSSEKTQDIFCRLDQEVVIMYLDGEILETERTPNIRFLNQNSLDAFGFDQAYGFRSGRSCPRMI